MTDKIVSSATENFLEALATRAALSETKLQGLGYSQSEIDLLKRFENGESLTADELRSISGTCSGWFTCSSASASAFTVSYWWEWDQCPVVTMTDGAAMRWLPSDSSGYFLSSGTRNTETNIDYYWGSSKVFSLSGSLESGLSFSAIHVRFGVNELYTARESAYAKTGYIKTEVYLLSGVDNSIQNLQVAGAYGHTVVGLGMPSISASPGDNSLVIDFSLPVEANIDVVAARSAAINRSRVITYMS